jgi:hypothetical protein
MGGRAAAVRMRDRRRAGATGYVLAPMTDPPAGTMMIVMAAGSTVRPAAVLPLFVYVVSCVVQAALSVGPSRVISPAEWAVTVGLLAVPVVTGGLLS